MQKDHSAKFRALGRAIAYYRKEAGYSQEQLADAVGVSRTHISNIEAKNMNAGLSLDLIFTICDILNVTVVDLFSFHQDSNE